jgi:hypothetical protein
MSAETVDDACGGHNHIEKRNGFNNAGKRKMMKE